MGIASLIASALSNVPIPPVQFQGLNASFFQAPNDPNVQISQIDQISGYPLQYPQDRPKYYMSFDIYDYSRSSLTSLGTLQPSNYPSMVMPLPSQLVDGHQVHWSDRVEVGTVAGEGIAAVQAMVSGATDSARNSLITGATAAGLQAANKAISAVTGGDPLGGVESLLGLTPNQFMTVLMLGPLYKRHSFTWSLSPHNKKEAEVLRRIVQQFNNAMSPNLTAGGGIWTFPKIFQIILVPNNKYLYKFKPAVLENFTVNYTPGGRPSMYHDNDPSGQSNAPEGLMINARFLELEYWTEGNYSDKIDTPGNASTSYDTVPPSEGSLDTINNFVNTIKQFGTPNTPPPAPPAGNAAPEQNPDANVG